MASVTSLGVHKPSALPVLVAEGILPPEPSEDAFKWYTVESQGSKHDEEEEEIITTDFCVVWSRGGLVQRIFRFDIEGEPVKHAVFTQFPGRNTEDARLGTYSSYYGGSEETAGLTVPKQRAYGSTIKPVKDNKTGRKAPDIGHEQHLQGPLSSGQHQSDRTGRALVVVLKTQAHVFFLSETSHVVHLPFEVDAVFPSIHGVILQRKLAERPTVPATPQLPSVPNNSFAISQRTSSNSPPSSQPLANLVSSGDTASPIAPMLQKLLDRSTKAPEIGLPRTFCLIDPLIELGSVAVKGGSKVINSRRSSSRRSHPIKTSPFVNLDPKETLLYVSPYDELGHKCSSVPRGNPFLLAITENIDTRTLNVWTMTYLLDKEPRILQPHPDAPKSGTASRRRSSFAPGMGTGASTPTLKGATTGGARSFRHVSTDPMHDEPSQNQEEILDSAFRNPTVPAKSSRRVSGILARADLSTNNDRTSFADVHAGGRGGRKGTSFGASGSRLSAGLEHGTHLTKPHSLHGLRTSLDSVSLYEPQLDNLVDEFDGDHEHGGLDLGNWGLHPTIRPEVLFNKIYSMPCETRQTQSQLGNQDYPTRRIFTMTTPPPSIGDASYDSAIVLSIVDKVLRETLLLQIKVSYTENSEQRQEDAPVKVSGYHRARVIGMTRRTGVIDACQISDSSCSRLLILGDSENGMGELSLQAPWTSPARVELPRNLLLHNPHRIANDTLSPRREGGFKRVLSQGPQALIALQHMSGGCLDALDSAKLRHRIKLQLKPRNPLVAQMISVSDSVLPSSETDCETVLRGWWDTMTWLQNGSECETDLEWTALVVLLFAMGADIVSDNRVEATTRQRKKKGGLLRSSSGANTNLDSWDAMLSQEGSKSGLIPTWMQSGAWDWVPAEKSQVLTSKASRSSRSSTSQAPDAVPIPKKSSLIIDYISKAREFIKSPIGQTANGSQGYLPTASSRDPDVRRIALASILVGLHLLREELKLNVMAAAFLHQLTPVLAQIGIWLGWESWGKAGYYLTESEEMDSWSFEDSMISALKVPPQPFEPPSILQFIESANKNPDPKPMVSLLDVASSPISNTVGKGSEEVSRNLMRDLTPRTMAITNLLTSRTEGSAERRVAEMASWGVNISFLETLPESVAVPFRAAIAACQARPPTMWKAQDLQMIEREDMALLERDPSGRRINKRSSKISSNNASRDVHTICHQAPEVDRVSYDASGEHDRSSITRLLYKEDQRFAEASKLLHPVHHPIAYCAPEPEWSDTDLLEAQQELAKVVGMRTLSVSPGRSLLFFGGGFPLLTEKWPINGFTLGCVMKPTDTTVTADRAQFSEEKTSWAFFHAGAQAGLSISQDAKGIDTSWILFNKPREHTNRHAGLLFALGLNGHLKSLAKWVAFRYLTPKHTMTSIGLLLGLSASFLGTMDSLVTRLLSVHVIRMLPPGAAELNLSPLTQTSGIMGIGLLYCNTQHRRMSEIMLSEIENIDQDDTSSPLDDLRDEGYRLAAGFALGYINLGTGEELKGLHDMRIPERLLVLAVGTRRVEIVHILDKAAPAATVAIALIFMKTQDEALARKIDIPDTIHQFDYVRPDTFLLRTLARHLIMWDDIRATPKWISLQLPLAYQHKSGLATTRTLTSEDMSFFNVVAGVCLAIGLRFAGSGSLDIRNLLGHYLDQFIRICRLPALNYDSRLARTTARNCQDILALAASCVMAGTGDLHIFRRLRSLHGRTDAETPYGSHLATHLAIGVLFMGGGTHTFGTSNLAVASLLCAFYPLFPNTVLDNRSHLQAFRHFWVLATEKRCLVPRDVHTHRPITLPILIILKSGAEVAATAPCLLPELQTVSEIKTNDPQYWSVTLDIANNSSHKAAFARHQSIYVRRRAAYDAYNSVFCATMQALNDAQTDLQFNQQSFRWIFSLPTFAGFDRAEQALILPTEVEKGIYKGTRGTVVDDRLVLEKTCLQSGRAEKLWNLRILFAWAEGCRRSGEECGWLGNEVVERLRAGLAMRRWSMKDG